MPHLNIEIKAKLSDFKKTRKILKEQKALFMGVDHQADTYFKVKKGRLKLREGKIENDLIFYQRKNTKGPKQCEVILLKNSPDSALKEILKQSLGILVVVDKKREIYFIENIKIHLDQVKKLGKFIEIEARDEENIIGLKRLRQQCDDYLKLFGIKKKDLVSNSYSDLLLKTSS